jgi:predicted RNase H-like HicB family nuclease
LYAFDLKTRPATYLYGRSHKKQEIIMKAEFTAIIEPAPEGGFWAICPEVPGANGQGETIEDAKNNLREAIELLLEDRKADILRGLPDDAIQDKVMVG